MVLVRCRRAVAAGERACFWRDARSDRIGGLRPAFELARVWEGAFGWCCLRAAVGSCVVMEASHWEAVPAKTLGRNALTL